MCAQVRKQESKQVNSKNALKKVAGRQGSLDQENEQVKAARKIANCVNACNQERTKPSKEMVGMLQTTKAGKQVAKSTNESK